MQYYNAQREQVFTNAEDVLEVEQRWGFYKEIDEGKACSFKYLQPASENPRPVDIIAAVNHADHIGEVVSRRHMKTPQEFEVARRSYLFANFVSELINPGGGLVGVTDQRVTDSSSSRAQDYVDEYLDSRTNVAALIDEYLGELYETNALQDLAQRVAGFVFMATDLRLEVGEKEYSEQASIQKKFEEITQEHEKTKVAHIESIVDEFAERLAGWNGQME